MEKKHPVLRFLFKLTIFSFVFLLGFGFAKRLGEERAIKGERIGVIEVKGVIKNAQDILEKLVKFEKNKHIKAVILRINSPGGAVGPSQEVYLQVMKLRQKKPVVASLGTIAASGGYYIAAAATKIVAVPGTLTGSIGVKIEFANIKKLLEKLGIEPAVIKSVPYKDIGSPLRQMSPEERALLEKVVKDVHHQFVEAIAKGRNMPVEKIEAIADGSIFTGKEAKKLGLVDELGNFEDAVKLAAKLGGIKGEPKLYYPKEKISWTKLLMDNMFEALDKHIQQIKFDY
ncbi:MAG: signal peptide peptidase SppA [Candidatus Desulfofervidaceae bacterium]|nr:signal peptide peptidase SppA [Candidatus Desulfofervidaceae bacterium]